MLRVYSCILNVHSDKSNFKKAYNFDVSSTIGWLHQKWRPLDVTAVKYANVRTCPAPLVLGLGSWRILTLVLGMWSRRLDHVFGRRRRLGEGNPTHWRVDVVLLGGDSCSQGCCGCGSLLWFPVTSNHPLVLEIWHCPSQLHGCWWSHVQLLPTWNMLRLILSVVVL